MQIENHKYPDYCLASIASINKFIYKTNEPTEYFYDRNGNMTEDKNKGITVEYNLLNLPTTVKWDKNRKIEWLYSADGAKLRKTIYNLGEIEKIVDYVNGFEYETIKVEETAPPPSLVSFPMSEGRIVKSGANLFYNYQLKDHLGNVRVSFSNEQPGQLQLTGRNFYYPFGLREEKIHSNPENKYLYNGKELEDEHGLYWYHYGARYYDPQIVRWHTMDPADEFNSPYLYVGNNPVMLIDPDGRQVTSAIPIPPGYNKEYDNIKTNIWDVVFRAVTEPYDWARTAIDWANGDFSYWDLAGLLPIVPAGLRKTYEKIDEIKVIGRLPDTEVAKNWPGHDVLDIKDWTKEKNMKWVDEGIKNKQTFYLASPLEGNLIQKGGLYKGQATIFAEELDRLEKVGYKRIGDYMIHPDNIKNNK